MIACQVKNNRTPEVPKAPSVGFTRGVCICSVGYILHDHICLLKCCKFYLHIMQPKVLSLKRVTGEKVTPPGDFSHKDILAGSQLPGLQLASFMATPLSVWYCNFRFASLIPHLLHVGPLK